MQVHSLFSLGQYTARLAAAVQTILQGMQWVCRTVYSMYYYLILQAQSLVCMTEVLQAIGSYKTVPSPSGGYDRVCLAACEDQTNDIQISHSVMPNR